jgi:hypothetical protein
LGLFVEYLVCDPKIKGFETPFKQAQPPAKNAQNQHQHNEVQSKSGFVPKISRKNEKIWKNLKKWSFRFCGKNGEKCENGGRLVADGGWVGRREAGGGERVVGLQWVTVGVKDLDVWEEERRRWGEELVQRYSDVGENGKK